MLLIKLKPFFKASGPAVTITALSVAVVWGSTTGRCLAQIKSSQPAFTSSHTQSEPQEGQSIAALLQSARAQVRENPSDYKAHFALAELLRKSGRQQDSSQEYLQATEIDPALYVAYHQLSVVSSDTAELDQAIARLTKLKDEKPKDLMLRVALSEILEKRGSFYQGARVLVDLVYQNAVPDKYLPKVNARIHYLLVKSRDSQEVDKSAAFSEEELDTLPPPLPEATFHKNLAAYRLKESRVMRGVGHAPLLP